MSHIIRTLCGTAALAVLAAPVPSLAHSTLEIATTCPHGEAGWVDVLAPGQDPHDLAHPALVLTIAESGTQAGHSGHGAVSSTATATEAAGAGDIAIETPWMRQPPPGADVAGGYMTIRNAGALGDRLVGGKVPFAERLEIHDMTVTDGMMRMQEVAGGLDIPAGESVDLAPGGLHIMMMGLGEPPRAGDSVPLTLEFEKAGTVELEMIVAPMGASKPPMDHGGMDHGGMDHGGMDHGGMDHGGD